MAAVYRLGGHWSPTGTPPPPQPPVSSTHAQATSDAASHEHNRHTRVPFQAAEVPVKPAGSRQLVE